MESIEYQSVDGRDVGFLSQLSDSELGELVFGAARLMTYDGAGTEFRESITSRLSAKRHPLYGVVRSQVSGHLTDIIIAAIEKHEAYS